MQSKWEVEQKYVLSAEAPFRRQLAQEGFDSHRIEQHTDLYFRHPCRDFRQTDEAFRLRRIDQETCVTYKGRRRRDTTVKSRPEIELSLVPSEYEHWKSMLVHLGFQPLPEVRKTREVFTQRTPEYAGLVITLDNVEQIGKFVEIELVVESQIELGDAQARILCLAEQLGLTEIQPLSYLAQLLKKLGAE